jgi:hypothetical protein
MTLCEGTRVVIGKNGYDDNTPNDPYTFLGYFGVVQQINTSGSKTLYYVRFEDPRVSAWFGEPYTTAWPFYDHELVVADA